MIRFYFHPTPNPAKIALFLEETGLAYEALPVDTSKGEQHAPAFRAINPNGKVPAIVDTEGPGGNEVRVFDSTAILIYLAEKTGQLLGTSEDRPELLSWLLFIASGLGPFSGQAVHFQFAAPEGLDYAANRYRREAERHYQVLNDHLSGREFIVGSGFTIADISAWGWLDLRFPRAQGRRGSSGALSRTEAVVRRRGCASGGRSRPGARQEPCVQGDQRRGDQACALPVELSPCIGARSLKWN